MLTLFQNITEELTPYEKDVMVCKLIDLLYWTNERRRRVATVICKELSADNYTLSESRLRKMINYIRVMNVKQGRIQHLGDKVVIGASNGYFITNDPEIIKDQIESLQGRIDSMAAAVDTLKAQLLSIQKSRA